MVWIALALPSSAGAIEIRDYDRIVSFVAEASATTAASDLDRVLREAAKGPAPEASVPIDRGYGIIWFDNWTPRARIWLRNVTAEELFQKIFKYQYLVEATDIDGTIDVDLEFFPGRPSEIRGRLRLRNVTIRWRKGDFALTGINGTIPFVRTIGEAGVPSAAPAMLRPAGAEPNLDIKSMVWADRVLAEDFTAIASYRDRILRFDKIGLHAMGGAGEGTVVIDHRFAEWRMAAMLRFHDAELNRLHEVLPGLPVLARLTRGKLRGDIALVYQAPDALQLSGEVRSTEPGAIKLSPRLYESVKEHMTEPSIEYQKLTMTFHPDDSGVIEGEINVYRSYAKTVLDMARGKPFAPPVINLRFPLIPFMSELTHK